MKRGYLSIQLSAIHAGLAQLRQYKKRAAADRLAEIEWEIKLYEWILDQPDAELKADQYLTERHVDGVVLPKREVVRRLGWPL